MTTERERTILETTDEMRMAACYVAGYVPGDTHRIIPVRQYAPKLPKETPEDREGDASPDAERTRRTYVIGTVYGGLRVMSSRSTARGGGRRYVCQCERCGTTSEYAGSALNLADRRGSPCKACRRKCLARGTRVAA